MLSVSLPRVVLQTVHLKSGMGDGKYSNCLSSCAPLSLQCVHAPDRAGVKQLLQQIPACPSRLQVCHPGALQPRSSAEGLFEYCRARMATRVWQAPLRWRMDWPTITRWPMALQWAVSRCLAKVWSQPSSHLALTQLPVGTKEDKHGFCLVFCSGFCHR